MILLSPTLINPRVGKRGTFFMSLFCTGSNGAIRVKLNCPLTPCSLFRQDLAGSLALAHSGKPLSYFLDRHPFHPLPLRHGLNIEKDSDREYPVEVKLYNDIRPCIPLSRSSYRSVLSIEFDIPLLFLLRLEEADQRIKFLQIIIFFSCLIASKTVSADCLISNSSLLD